jgi:Spy/CpxP family protein refolding chaperone
MVFLPGAALVASEAFAQSQADAVVSRTSGISAHKALKAASKYGTAKYAYKIPKSAAKQAKYVNFLTTFLSLTPNQQTQVNSIFSAALASKVALKTQIRTAHETLSNAVKTNNSAAIAQATAAIGTLGAQRHTIGAQANASFYQILTAAQQASLSAFQSKNTSSSAA